VNHQHKMTYCPYGEGPCQNCPYKGNCEVQDKRNKIQNKKAAEVSNMGEVKDEPLDSSTRILLRKQLEGALDTGMEGRADSILQQLLQNDDFIRFIREHYSVKVDLNRPDEAFLHQEKRYFEDKFDDIVQRNNQFTDYAKENNPRRVDMSTEVFMCRLSIALFREVGEMTDNIPWKWWGRGVWELTPERKQKALEEAIDLLHFWIEFCRCIGADSTDIYRAYCEKNDENWNRFKEQKGWDKNNEENQV